MQILSGTHAQTYIYKHKVWIITESAKSKVAELNPKLLPTSQGNFETNMKIMYKYCQIWKLNVIYLRCESN